MTISKRGNYLVEGTDATICKTYKNFASAVKFAKAQAVEHMQDVTVYARDEFGSYVPVKRFRCIEELHASIDAMYDEACAMCA